MNRSGLWACVALAWLAGGCGDDRGRAPSDAGGFADAAVGMDAGGPRDAGPALDGTTPEADAGGLDDAGASMPDATTGEDAGVAPDSGCAPPYHCPAYPSPRVEWASDYSGGPAYIGDVAFDSGGGVVLCGTYVGAVDLGGGPIVLSGTRNMFVARMNVDGTLAWTRRIVASDRDVAVNGVAVDASGNVYASGWGTGTLDFGAGPVAGPPAGGLRPGFVVKLDPDGGFVWQQRFAMLALGSIVVDSMGRPFVLGTFNSTLDLGAAGMFSSGPGGADQLLVALAATDGTVRFARVRGESDRVDPSGLLAIGPGDDLWVAAAFSSSSGADSGMWLERLDPMGMPRWHRRDVAPAAPLTPEVFDLGVGGTGDAVLLGKGAPDFGDGALSGTWIARFAGADGAYEWSDLALGPQRLAVDESDRIWVSGNWSGVSLSLRPAPCTFATAGYGPYLLELDAAGAYVGFGAFTNAGTFAMAARAGRVAVAGRSNDPVDLGCGPRMSDFEEPFVVSLTH